MHLAEIAALRAIPAAGIQLALTQRCPLSCAHCSTDSSMGGTQFPGGPFRRLVESFTRDDHPEVMLMSGGEPLLRAGLVAELAGRARQAGTRSYVLSGMYFARSGRGLPGPIRRALGSVDHLAASLDAHHEREVARAEVYRAVHAALDLVPGVSFQLTGVDDDDPYLAEAVADIRREFADRVPVLVTHLQPTGRARAVARPSAPVAGPAPGPADGPAPCDFATWPLVGYDGTVYGCARQSLLERHRPAHLVLGQAADGWPALRARREARALLRMVRAIGPELTQRRFGSGERAGGPCATCMGLSEEPATAARAQQYLAGAAGQAVERMARALAEDRDPYRFVARWGSARYSRLVALGWEDACAG
ncbi:hypothetical protein [Nonomuraea sp. NPDC003709]|uniref:hypothetical protein n=1 Tax=Nonomuraea sp. NPDC003709 TaxID=3154450 RepID=UPI0033B8AED3